MVFSDPIYYGASHCEGLDLPALTAIAARAMNKRLYKDWTCILQVGNEALYSIYRENGSGNICGVEMSGTN